MKHKAKSQIRRNKALFLFLVFLFCCFSLVSLKCFSFFSFFFTRLYLKFFSQRAFLFLPYSYTDLFFSIFLLLSLSLFFTLFSPLPPFPIFLIVILSSLMSKSILPLSNLIKRSLAYHLSSFFFVATSFLSLNPPSHSCVLSERAQ